MIAAISILLFVTIQRLGELVLARRNTLRLLARGGVERAGWQYGPIVALHAVWLAGLWLLAWDSEISLPWLGVFVLLQAVRVWTLFTLGDRWTTRVIIVPGEARINAGPYRFFRHPNYLVVIGEIATLPLVFGMPLYALVFSIMNAILLYFRIMAENAALDEAEA
ncbi:MAG: isoprenylcysteine carboxylmethyltransferase family protein [Pseudomonadota bacterium]